MVTRKTQVISSNFFALAREISDLVLRISSALRSFPIFLILDFLRLLDAHGKVLKFCINVQKDLAKLLNGLLDLAFYWVTITSIFYSSGTSFLSWMKLYIWNWLEALNMKLLPLLRNGKYTNCFRLFNFHNYLKWDNFCHYE